MFELLHKNFEENGLIWRPYKNGNDGLHVQNPQQGEQKAEQAAVWLRYGDGRLGDLWLFFLKPNQQHKMMMMNITIILLFVFVGIKSNIWSSWYW